MTNTSKIPAAQTVVNAYGMDQFLREQFQALGTLKREEVSFVKGGRKHSVRTYSKNGTILARGVYQEATIMLRDPWTMISGVVFDHTRGQ